MLTYLFFKISKLKSSNKALTESEARALFDKYNVYPREIKLEIRKDRDGSHWDAIEDVVIIEPDDLYEEVILHELGHALLTRTEGTANHKRLQYLSDNSPVHRDTIVDSEKEAWDFYKDRSSKPIGKRTRVAMFLATDSYKSLPEWN